MTRVITVLLAMGVVIALAACVTPQNTGKEVTVFNVNGRGVTATELLKSPMVRQAIKQYLVTDALMREAGKAGIYADEEAIDEQMKQIEQDAISQDLTLEEYLTKKQYVTVEEVRESMRMSQLFEKLVESKVSITDDERQAYWEEHQDEVKYTYGRDNHLTEAEVGDLTIDVVATTLDELIRREKVGQTRSELLTDLTNNIELELLVMSDQEQAQLYEDLLINFSKTLPEVEEEPAPEQPAEGAEPAPDAEAAGATGTLQRAPGAGEGSAEGAETPPAEGSGEGAPEPPAEPGGGETGEGGEGAGE